MWPFKKKPIVEWATIAAEFPPAPCGDQSLHYQWVELEGFPCPKCSANNARIKEVRERELLADAIAERVAARIAKSHVG